MLAGNVLITGGYVEPSRNADGTYKKVRTASWSEDTWDDGYEDWAGRLRVYLPEHPRAKGSGFVFRAWAVWWLHTGEDAPKGYDVHHKSGDRKDDRFENLTLLTHADHIRHHQAKEPVTLICAGCDEPFALPQWRINQGRGKFCSQECYHKTPRTLPPHGTRTRYGNHGCRCVDCERAGQDYRKRSKLRGEAIAC